MTTSANFPTPNLSGLTSLLQQQLTDAKTLLAHLQQDPVNLTDFIARLYLELRSTPKVAKRLQAMGIKRSAAAQFQPADVMQLLDVGGANLPDALWREVGKIKNRNGGLVKRRWEAA